MGTTTKTQESGTPSLWWIQPHAYPTLPGFEPTGIETNSAYRILRLDPGKKFSPGVTHWRSKPVSPLWYHWRGKKSIGNIFTQVGTKRYVTKNQVNLGWVEVNSNQVREREKISQMTWGCVTTHLIKRRPTQMYMSLWAYISMEWYHTRRTKLQPRLIQ